MAKLSIKCISFAESFFGTYSIMLPNLVIAFGVAVSAIVTVCVLPSERFFPF